MYDPVGPASVEAQESYGNDKERPIVLGYIYLFSTLGWWSPMKCPYGQVGLVETPLS